MAVKHIKDQVSEHPFEVCNPLYEDYVWSARWGRFLAALKPLFPGYILVRMDLDLPGWQRIRGTRGVDSVISLAGCEMPAALPEHVADEILVQCHSGPVRGLGWLEKFNPGAEVTVREGPFDGLPGRVDRRDEQRCWVLLNVLGTWGKRPLEFTAGSLELAA